jgi:hypothetical protein
MRWSLSISLVPLSLLAILVHGLVLPRFPDLATRGRNEIAGSSKSVRQTSEFHDYCYYTDPNDEDSIIRMPVTDQTVEGRQAGQWSQHLRQAFKEVSSNVDLRSHLRGPARVEAPESQCAQIQVGSSLCCNSCRVN